MFGSTWALAVVGNPRHLPQLPVFWSAGFWGICGRNWVEDGSAMADDDRLQRNRIIDLALPASTRSWRKPWMTATRILEDADDAETPFSVAT